MGVACAGVGNDARAATTPSLSQVDAARTIAQWRTQLTRGAREDPTTRFPNLLPATFRARLRAAAAHDRFRVVRVELLRPLQRAPIVIVQPMSKAALAAPRGRF
jgi:hypothetical protein